MEATRSSGKRENTPWQTNAAMVSWIGRCPPVMYRNESSRKGSISLGPVQSLWYRV